MSSFWEALKPLSPSLGLFCNCLKKAAGTLKEIFSGGDDVTGIPDKFWCLVKFISAWPTAGRESFLLQSPVVAARLSST